MTKTKARAKRKLPTRDEAVNLLSAVQRKRSEVEADCRRLRAQFIASALAGDSQAVRKQLRSRVDVLHRLTDGEQRLKTILGEDAKIILDNRKVEDPLTTQAQIVEQRRKWPDAHDIGRITTSTNLVTLVGGFARFERKTEAELAAAMRFLSLSEIAKISDARATDYSQPMVDTSWSGDGEKVMLSGDAARKELDRLKAAIGGSLFNLLHAVIVNDSRLRSIAGEDASGPRVAAIAGRVRHGLHCCAEFWGLLGAPKARGGVMAWDDGSPAVYSGAIVNPRLPGHLTRE